MVIEYEWNNCCQLSFYGIISALVSEIAHMKQLTLDDVTILRFQLFVFLKVCKGEMRGLSLHFLMVGVILIVLCHCQHATFQLQNNPLPIVDYKKKPMPFRVPFLCLIFFFKIIQITINRFKLLTCPVDVAFMTWNCFNSSIVVLAYTADIIIFTVLTSTKPTYPEIKIMLLSLKNFTLQCIACA